MKKLEALENETDLELMSMDGEISLDLVKLPLAWGNSAIKASLNRTQPRYHFSVSVSSCTADDRVNYDNLRFFRRIPCMHGAKRTDSSSIGQFLNVISVMTNDGLRLASDNTDVVAVMTAYSFDVVV